MKIESGSGPELEDKSGWRVDLACDTTTFERMKYAVGFFARSNWLPLQQVIVGNAPCEDGCIPVLAVPNVTSLDTSEITHPTTTVAEESVAKPTDDEQPAKSDAAIGFGGSAVLGFGTKWQTNNQASPTIKTTKSSEPTGRQSPLPTNVSFHSEDQPRESLTPVLSPVETSPVLCDQVKLPKHYDPDILRTLAMPSDVGEGDRGVTPTSVAEYNAGSSSFVNL